MKSRPGLLSQLSGWYATQCNGDWEHLYGITIESLDNPGWRMKVDLVGTPFETRSDFETRENWRDCEKWLVIRKIGTHFEGAGAPGRLDAIIAGFLNWKDGSDG